jgi:hypothetical protein
MLQLIARKITFYTALISFTSGVLAIGSMGVSKVHEFNGDFGQQQHYSEASGLCEGVALIAASASLSGLLVVGLTIREDDK